MKKKAGKKLVLAKETVRRLDEGPAGVVGGFFTYVYGTACDSACMICDAQETVPGCIP